MRKARKQGQLTLLDLKGFTDIKVYTLSDIERGLFTPSEDEAAAIRLALLSMSEIEEDLKKLERWGNKKTHAPEYVFPRR